MTLPAGLGDVRRRHSRRSQVDRRDGVFAMAVRAHGRIAHPGLDRNAVNAPQVGLLDVVVAFAASVRHVLPVELRRGVRGLVQVVRTVTVRADRRIQFLLLHQRDAVDALLIAGHGPALAEMKLLHLRGIAVAPPARGRQIRAIHRRLRVAEVEQVVVVPMAILARGRLLHPLVDRLAMVAFQVNLRLDAVASRAGHRLRREVVRMRQVGDVRVATDAQVLRVNGVREPLFVHVERGALVCAVAGDQRPVAMAGQTVGVVQRAGGPRGEREQRDEHQQCPVSGQVGPHQVLSGSNWRAELFDSRQMSLNLRTLTFPRAA